MLKHIIFDLGGVILNLDTSKTVDAFSTMGIQLAELSEKYPVFQDFETGKVNAHQFREFLKIESAYQFSDREIDDAWNKMLLELPAQRIDLVQQLGKKYNLYLLSNTNEIHMQEIYRYTNLEHGPNSLNNLFQQVFLSYEIGLRKPHVECYQHVIQELHIDPREAVFIDDNELNLEGASLAGLHTIHATQPVDSWLIDALQAF